MLRVARRLSLRPEVLVGRCVHPAGRTLSLAFPDLDRRHRATWTGSLRTQLLEMASVDEIAVAEGSSGIPEAAISALHIVRGIAKEERDRDELERQQQEEPEEELRQLYDAEIEEVEGRIALAVTALESELIQMKKRLNEGAEGEDPHGLQDDIEARNAILELAPGVGGQEAALFAGELFDMYQRFCEAQGWRFQVDSRTEATGGGLQSCNVKILDPSSGAGDLNGDGPFGYLFCESGGHRVQRIPETERKGRMQTSSAVVVVMPIAEERDLVISKQDLKIDIAKKSSGPGGQSVNTANQAVRMLHIPSGISVFCATSQSQYENRIMAMDMLRTKLLQQEIQTRNEYENKQRKEQKGTGDRSDKIRTYNFQRDEVIDHRLGKDSEAGVLGANDVLFGDGLQALLNEHRARARADRLEDIADKLYAIYKSKTT